MNFKIESNEIYLLNDEGIKLAFVKFPALDEKNVIVTTTYVSDVLRGQGIAGKLMQCLYEELKRTNRLAIMKCSYAVSWFEKNIDKQDILSK